MAFICPLEVQREILHNLIRKVGFSVPTTLWDFESVCVVNGSLFQVSTFVETVDHNPKHCKEL